MSKNISKDTIKKLMKEILIEDNTLSLNKEITNKVSNLDKEIKKLEKSSFKELIQDTSVSFPLICDFDLEDFNEADVIKELNECENEVIEFLKLKKDFPKLQETHFDIAGYYLKRKHMDTLLSLIKLIQEFKIKIDLILN